VAFAFFLLSTRISLLIRPQLHQYHIMFPIFVHMYLGMHDPCEVGASCIQSNTCDPSAEAESRARASIKGRKKRQRPLNYLEACSEAELSISKADFGECATALPWWNCFAFGECAGILFRASLKTPRPRTHTSRSFVSSALYFSSFLFC